MSLSRPGVSALALTSLLLGACHGSRPQPCQHDSDCAGSEVCFIDGCGDPGQGLAVEVAPSASTSATTQDFLLGSLNGTEDLALGQPAMLQGELKRAPDNAQAAAPYTSRVSFRLNGRSALIPGISRHYETALATTVGSYAVPVSAGIYTVTVTPDDPSIPPFVDQNITVQAGSPLGLDVQFAPDPDLLKVHGTLLGTNAPVTTVLYTVQALASDTRLPVSQPSAVSASGDFALFVSPSVHAQQGYVVQVAPGDASAVAPRKSFAVADVSTLVGPLMLGMFGDPTLLSGVVTDGQQQPVPNATVYVEGTIADGGTFSSARAHTDAQGGYQLSTLPALPGASLSVVAVPPAGVAAGTVRQGLVTGQGSVALTCPGRLLVEGRLLRPGGTPALNVPVSVTALAGTTADAALPPGGDSVTDTDGRFSIYLEPGQYRLDALPQDLPRLSRFMALTDASSAALPDLTLSLGKRITGTVMVSSPTGDSRPANLALVRYFRIGIDASGNPSAVVLGETYTDSNGSYGILLPTR